METRRRARAEPKDRGRAWGFDQAATRQPRDVRCAAATYVGVHPVPGSSNRRAGALVDAAVKASKAEAVLAPPRDSITG